MDARERANHSIISDYQFGAHGSIKTDPLSDQRKPNFSGASGSKTMRVERGSGLPSPQKKHKHRNHAGARTRRAR
jgi:hypothetical protein